MHELSIIVDLINLCEKNAIKNNAKICEKIIIKVGKLSGVEPHLLENAFEFYKQTSQICKNAKLEIIHQSVIAKCQDCGNEAEILDYNFYCKKCTSTNLKIIDGEDMYLMKLVLV